jgi:DNA-binding response OmpR family regulator
MTLPQYRRRECLLDGAPIHLSPHEAELVALLLVSPPDRPLAYETLVEGLWPDPDTQALTALGVLGSVVVKLRRKGVPIETEWGWGFFISARERGVRQPHVSSARPRCWGCGRRLAA